MLFHFISWIVTRCIHLWYNFVIYLRWLIIVEGRCNVIMRRPLITIFAVAKQKVTYRILLRGCPHSCLFSAPHYKAICARLTLAHFPTYLINGRIFRKTFLSIKCAFWFSLQLLSKTFLILRKLQWHVIINV
jgi:hypothetical protein